MAKPATGVVQPLDLGRPASGTLFAALAAAAVLIILAGRLSGLGEVAEAETFALIFTSIVVEALPFVLLGASVSAGIEVFVPDRLFERVARLPVGLQLPGAALSGIAFPVCECGSVPVARRLIARGMHPAAGLAFMLASPIINPIVLASTFVAYSGRGVALQMVVGRAVLGLLLAVIAGWAIGARHSAGDLLRPRAAVDVPHSSHDVSANRGRRFVDHLAGDFFFMGRFVVIGSALAAGLQTIIPQSVISGVAGTPVVGALALMGLAFVLSLCSEADAFVAVSFVQFPVGAQMAFLVFGPVVDTKLSFLYGATFTKTFLGRLLVIAVPVTLAGSLWFEVVMR
ncbi:MAG: permease [Actinomycetota bacterium]